MKHRSTKASCITDCANDDRCGCAYWRLDDFPPLEAEGYCALTTVPCDQPDIGATHDATRTHTAFHKCAYEPSAADEAQFPEEAYEWIDWYGVWDFVYASALAIADRSEHCSCCWPMPACWLNVLCAWKKRIALILYHVHDILCPEETRQLLLLTRSFVPCADVSLQTPLSIGT